MVLLRETIARRGWAQVEAARRPSSAWTCWSPSPRGRGSGSR